MTESKTTLSSPFPIEALKKLNKGGTSLTYVPVSEVIARLNNVLGVNGWSITKSDAWRDELNPEWVLAKVEIVAEVNGVQCSRIGFGGQKVKRVDDPLDLGDEFKGATSDALKKAAQALGVGLELARDEEMIELERREGLERINRDTRKELEAKITSLDSDSKTQFGNWWKSNSIGSLKKGDVTVEDYDRIVAKLEEILEPSA